VSIRLRLALVYTAVFAFVLFVFGFVLHLAVERHMARTMDEALAGLAIHGAAAITAGDHYDPADFALANLDPFSAPGVHVQVLDASGQATAHSAGLGIHALPESRADAERALAGESTFYTAHLDGERIRVYNVPLRREGAVVGVLQFGKSFHDLDLTLSQLSQLMFGATLLALLLAGAAGWAVAGRALAPVAEITATARAVAEAQAFDRRLAGQRSGDEVGQMALAFNEMLASLEAAYTAQRRFVADASHELRAPLTTIKGNLEFTLRARDLPPEVREEAMADALGEAERMGRLVDDLLSLARADAGQKVNPQAVAMQVILADLGRTLAPAAGQVELRFDRLEAVAVWGDPDRLKQLALILVDNALKYTPAGGRVEVSLTRQGDWAVLRVADTGLGIDPGDLPHVFERFYRADKARAREGGGAGLGLAIAKSIVDQHGATISVQSEPGRGSEFTVCLPVSRVSPSPTQQLDYAI
jgi:heavy metal sensor kinase